MMIQPKQPKKRIIRDMAIYIEKPTHNWQLFTPIFFAIYLKSNNNYRHTKCPVSYAKEYFISVTAGAIETIPLASIEENADEM